MKIVYLHGLESKIDQKDPKIIFLNNNFDEVYTPSINYKDKGTFAKLFAKIKSINPDLIVGSSLGGYFAYLIGSKLGIQTVLFNPAVVDRGFDPVVDDSKLKGTKHNVFLGKSDNVINGEKVMRYFGHAGSGSFYYTPYKGGHRVPEDVFINAIKDKAGIKEQEFTQIYKKRKFIMKHIRTINEEFINLSEGKIARYQIGNKEVTKDEVLDHMYNSKKEAGMKWKQTNSPKTQKDITKLVKQYGEGNVAIHGLTNGGDPVADVYVKESVNEGRSTIDSSTFGDDKLKHNDQFRGNTSLAQSLSADLGFDPKKPWADGVGFDDLAMYASGKKTGTILNNALSGKFTYADLLSKAKEFLSIKESEISESTIGIKTDGNASVKGIQKLRDDLDKAKIKYKFNRLSMTLSVIDMDKKFFADAKKIVDDSGLAILLAKESEDTMNEGFSEWEMSFAPMVLSGVKLDPKNVYKVKARSTVEAIKKAAKEAGLSGNDWMATVTNKLEKLK
jgi:hypothetical protein